MDTQTLGRALARANEALGGGDAAGALEFLLQTAEFERALARGVVEGDATWDQALALREGAGSRLGELAARCLPPFDPDGPADLCLSRAVDLLTLGPLLPIAARATEALAEFEARVQLEPEEFAEHSAWAADQLEGRLAGVGDPAWALLLHARAAAQVAATPSPALQVDLDALLDRAWRRSEAARPILERLVAWGSELAGQIAGLLDDVVGQPLPAAAQGRGHEIDPDWEEPLLAGESESLWLRAYGAEVVLVWSGEAAPERLVAKTSAGDHTLRRMPDWEGGGEHLFRWPRGLAPGDVTSVVDPG